MFAQVAQERPFGVEFARYAEPEHRVGVVNRVDMDIAVALTFEIFVVDDLPQKRERAQFLEQGWR